MITRDYEAMTLKQVTGDLISSLFEYNARRSKEAGEDVKALLRAYIVKGGTNPKAKELLANLEGK